MGSDRAAALDPRVAALACLRCRPEVVLQERPVPPDQGPGGPQRMSERLVSEKKLSQSSGMTRDRHRPGSYDWDSNDGT